MPIYEYQCSHCENRIEVLQKLNDLPLEDCPACNKSSLKKLVSAASFRLKGKGWYETDFKTGDKKKLAESDSKNKETTDSAAKDPKVSENKKETQKGTKGTDREKSRGNSKRSIKSNE
ncbi:MAG: zinc ribbon domain-containing protein [Gammaproteobacteria bacterium]|nr:zinc ribbon domain-containing protein [Gammaproteobacteria bacterium]